MTAKKLSTSSSIKNSFKISNGQTSVAIPNAPTIGSATNVGTAQSYNSGSATLTYTAATLGAAATSFTATSAPGSFTGTGSSPITVLGLQSNTGYTFTVKATNANGDSTASTSSSSITATTVPQAPTIGTYTDGGDSTTGTLSFTAGATGGSAITNYSYSTDSSTYTTLSPAQTTSPLSLSGLTDGTYTFSVKAINANGTSSASGGISGTVVSPITGSMYHIASTTLSTATSTVTFGSIPADYTHLQIRVLSKSTTTSGTDTYGILRFNTDSGANYSYHGLYGNGSTAYGDIATANTTFALFYDTMRSATGFENKFGTTVIDILDYGNTNKYKTVRALGGYDSNDYGFIALTSSNWRNTAAISTATLTLGSGDFATYSSVSLYGIK